MPEWFDKQRIGDLPRWAASRWASREALVYESERWTYRDFADEVDDWAKGLITAGVQPGDRVALWLPNRPEWLFAFFAAIKVGAIAVPMNTRLRVEDASHVLRASGASLLLIREKVGPVDFVELAEGVLRSIAPDVTGKGVRSGARSPLLVAVVDGEGRSGGCQAWSSVSTNNQSVEDSVLRDRAEQVDPDAPALILFTSGSTGLPKGVVHSHCVIRNVIDEANRMDVRPTDTVLMYLPLFHTLGLYEGPLTMLVAGARMVLHERFDAAEVLRTIERERCSLIHGFDTHFRDILMCPELERRDTTTLRTGILAAGMASTEPIAREAQSRLMSAVSGWGMTEVGCGALLGSCSDAIEARCASSGFPLPGYEFRVVDPISGEMVADGETGELRVRSYQMFLEYYGDPEATAASFDSEGWFRTGDQAVQSCDGSIRFLGRYKDILKVGGENVDPVEVELFIKSHPAVRDAQIVGRSDDRLGEIPVACIITAGSEPISIEDLRKFCRGRLASFKVPQDVLVMEDFPTTSSGKIQKFVLRDLVAVGFQEAAQAER